MHLKYSICLYYSIKKSKVDVHRRSCLLPAPPVMPILTHALVSRSSAMENLPAVTTRRSLVTPSSLALVGHPVLLGLHVVLPHAGVHLSHLARKPHRETEPPHVASEVNPLVEELAARLAAPWPSLGASVLVPTNRRWRGDAASLTVLEADTDALLAAASRTFSITIQIQVCHVSAVGTGAVFFCILTLLLKKCSRLDS